MKAYEFGPDFLCDCLKATNSGLVLACVGDPMSGMASTPLLRMLIWYMHALAAHCATSLVRRSMPDQAALVGVLHTTEY